MTDVKNNAGVHIFTLQRTFYVFLTSWFLMLFILLLPIWFIKAINGDVQTGYHQNPYAYRSYKYGVDFYFAYIIALLLFFIVMSLRRKFRSPWDPYFIITDAEIQYNTIAVPFNNVFLDKIIWKKIPLSRVREVQLLIRNEDKDKPGFRLKQNKKDVENAYKNVPYYTNRYSIFTGQMAAVFAKNQLLVISDSSGAIFKTINVTYAYEEELEKLQEFLTKRSITFTKKYVEMEDTVTNNMPLG